MAAREVAFVLVPGAFSPPTIYNRLATTLRSQGYTALPTQLQSAVVRGTRPAATFQDDVDHIQQTIVGLLDKDKDVVLVMNSYGGFPGTEASKGLSRCERGEGNGGALIGLVYLASFLPPLGSSLYAVYGVIPGVPADVDDGYRTMSMGSEGESGADIVFNDLPAAERQGFYDEFVNQSAAALHGEVTYTGYKTIPSIYVACELDRVVEPKMQYDMIDKVNKDGANVRTIAIQAGHCPMASQPEKIAEILLEAATAKA